MADSSSKSRSFRLLLWYMHAAGLGQLTGCRIDALRLRRVEASAGAAPHTHSSCTSSPRWCSPHRRTFLGGCTRAFAPSRSAPTILSLSMPISSNRLSCILEEKAPASFRQASPEV